VVLDTTRADAVSADGGEGAETPTLDRLAEEGVLYTQARSTSAWTVPSHGSLFTGLYPSRHGAHHEHLKLDPQMTTVAEALAPEYATAGFSENPHVSRGYGFAQGFEHFEETWRGRPAATAVPPTADRVMAWLRARDRERPFLVFINFMTPHLPYAPDRRFERRFVPAGADPKLVEGLRRFNEWDARLVMTGRRTLSPEQVSLLRDLYRADVAFADFRLARVVVELARERALDHTLVAVVGDHGENITDHGLMEHQFCLYDSLLRVPMILRLPGTFDGGRKLDAPVQLVDLAPTILQVAGVPKERWPVFQGVSLVDHPPPADRPEVAEYMRPSGQRWRFERVAPGFDFSRFDRRLRALVIGRWKVIVPEGGTPELYDVVADPGELHDVAAEHPDVVDRMATWLERWSQGDRHVTGEGAPRVDPETKKALEALGYVG